jgi:hypothetical protein
MFNIWKDNKTFLLDKKYKKYDIFIKRIQFTFWNSNDEFCKIIILKVKKISIECL